MPTAHDDLLEGWRYQQGGRYPEAQACYRKAVQAAPDNPEALFMLGTVCQRLGQIDESVACLLQAVSLKPDYAAAHNNLGVAFAAMGRRVDAVTHFRHVVRLRPDDPDACNNLGNALREHGELNESVERLRHSLRLRPNFPDALHNLGLALETLGRTDEARAHLERAVQLKPDFAEALSDLGLLLARNKRFEEAIKPLQQVVRMRPNRADSHMNYGAALREVGRLEESAEHLRRAAELRPDDATIRSSLGLTLQSLGDLNEAEVQLREAIRLDPQHADAHNNLAVTLAQMNRFDESIAHYNEAVRIKPDQPIYRRNRAISWLTLCDFKRGWPEFEYRWKCPGFVERPFRQPRWDGKPMPGQTVLLHPEQGLGDTILFIRFAARVKPLVGQVVFECPPVLVRLLRGVPGVDQIVPTGDALPAFDAHAPLASLPCLLNATMDDLSVPQPYIHAEPDRVEHWKSQLAAVPGFKVGISWQGNPKQSADRIRSIPLLNFGRLAAIEGAKLISLQKDFGTNSLRELGSAFSVIDLGSRLDQSGGAFLDTVAVMKNLDLVITCDTAIGHVAGALGVPVWVALCAAPDWRWFTNRDDTPWYATMRLFRQQELLKWDELFERMASELRKLTMPAANSRSIMVPIAPGELIDKITILQIKSERMRDPAKLANVNVELKALLIVQEQRVASSDALSRLTSQLKEVNEAIWQAEETIRAFERDHRFDERFIDVARMVYHQNDRRAAIKRQINALLKSEFIEEKEHPKYQ